MTLPSSSPCDLIHVFWHDGVLAHDAGAGIEPSSLEVLEKHPEKADRVRNMVSILRKGPIAPFVSWLSGWPAHVSDLLSFHSPEFIEELVQPMELEEKNSVLELF